MDSPTGQLALRPDPLAWARSRVVSTHDDLAERAATLRAGADDLLTLGWRGVAADQYAEAWGQWQGAAGQVLASLLDLSAAMALAGAQLEAADLDSGADVVALRARLGPG